MSDKELRKQLVEAFRVEGWGTGDCEPPCNCRGCYNAQNALASIALKVVRPLREQIAQEIEVSPDGD